MKKCKACGESFENKFGFCPIDGNVLEERKDVASYEYCPTLIADKPLAQRLIKELEFVLDRFRQAWPAFKAHPLTSTKILFDQLRENMRQVVARPHILSGSLIAAGLVLTVVVSVLIFEGHHKEPEIAGDADDLAPTITIDLNDTSPRDSKSGVGAGENGRVGFERGRGEGSRPVPARAQGGGGGGDRAQLPPSQGRLPQPSVIPVPIPTTYARLPPQAQPAAGIDIDPVLWKDLPFPNYGDPRSKSVTPSNGPGVDGGVGTNQGPGIGEGNGPGFGPGRKGNMGDGDRNIGDGGKSGANGDNSNGDIERVYRQPEVTVRARVLSKPEPQYTEEARRRQITGTVILSVVFSRNGQVTNMRAVQTLCCGLTEKAIASARQIRFVPATRNGQTVSTYMQLEYNFNLY